MGACPLLSALSEVRLALLQVHFGGSDYTASKRITASVSNDESSRLRFRTADAAGFPCRHWRSSLRWSDQYSSGRSAPRGVQEPRVSNHSGETRDAVHGAWRLGFNDNIHSLRTGFYQGWDLHPAQFVTRYAAVYSFFLEGLESASNRLKTFVEKAALASLFGDVFDDAATGQGLLNFFLRGIACGAITESEALATGLTLEELRTRSFLKILQGRRRK